MGFLLDIFYFVVVISILVAIHEFGHFIAARLTGMRAEIFSIGMGKRLFGYNKITGFTTGSLPEDWESNGYTDYRICLFPIGGYVKVSGMVDESFDTDTYKSSTPKPYEFRSKGTWAKIFVLSAGVIMNLLLAIFIFSLISFIVGEYHETTTRIGYVKENSLADKAGFIAGDKILKINGDEVSSWNHVIDKLTLQEFSSDREIQISRNNEIKNITIEGGKIIRTMADNLQIGIYKDSTKTVITDAIYDGPAWNAGIRKYDTIINVNSTVIGSYAQFQDIISNAKNEVEISLKRNDSIYTTKVIPNSDGLIQVGIQSVYLGDYYYHDYGVLGSIAQGWQRTVGSTKLIISSVGQIFAGNISFRESVGGPITIAKEATKYAEQGIISFLMFLSLLSISLAILNILPFPALDGGHLVFVVIEGLIRREVPLKLKMVFQQAGMIILLLFMVFVLYNDIVR